MCLLYWFNVCYHFEFCMGLPSSHSSLLRKHATWIDVPRELPQSGRYKWIKQKKTFLCQLDTIIENGEHFPILINFINRHCWKVCENEYNTTLICYSKHRTQASISLWRTFFFLVQTVKLIYFSVKVWWFQS